MSGDYPPEPLDDSRFLSAKHAVLAREAFTPELQRVLAANADLIRVRSEAIDPQEFDRLSFTIHASATGAPDDTNRCSVRLMDELTAEASRAGLPGLPSMAAFIDSVEVLDAQNQSDEPVCVKCRVGHNQEYGQTSVYHKGERVDSGLLAIPAGRCATFENGQFVHTVTPWAGTDQFLNFAGAPAIDESNFTRAPGKETTTAEYCSPNTFKNSNEDKSAQEPDPFLAVLWTCPELVPEGDRADTTIVKSSGGEARYSVRMHKDTLQSVHKRVTERIYGKRSEVLLPLDDSNPILEIEFAPVRSTAAANRSMNPLRSGASAVGGKTGPVSTTLRFVVAFVPENKKDE